MLCTSLISIREYTKVVTFSEHVAANRRDVYLTSSHLNDRNQSQENHVYSGRRGKIDLENCAYLWKIPSYAPEK